MMLAANTVPVPGGCDPHDAVCFGLAITSHFDPTAPTVAPINTTPWWQTPYGIVGIVVGAIAAVHYLKKRKTNATPK